MQLFLPFSPDVALLIENVFTSWRASGVAEVSAFLSVLTDDGICVDGDDLFDDGICAGGGDLLDATCSAPPFILKKDGAGPVGNSNSSGRALGQNKLDLDVALHDTGFHKALQGGDDSRIPLLDLGPLNIHDLVHLPIHYYLL